MDNSQKFYDLFWAILEQLPSLITIVGCLIFAAIRWKRSPRVSLVVVISLVLLLLHGPIFAAIYQWVPDLFIDRNTFRGPSYSSVVMLVIGFVYHTALAIPFVLLFVAIFMRRNRPHAETQV
jgi:hypothetical protein